ncbi:MAG: nitroreductase family protein [Fusobacterium sp.]|nr:nitroreductase family protein [Fusobacterium sp.]
MELLKILQNRRSIRKYTDENISEEDLEMILKSALLSPSGKNLKPWEFIVVRKKENIENLSKIKVGSSFIKNANALILVLGDSEKSGTWIEDTSIAIYNMHLMASYLGLASCWIQCRGRNSEDGQTCEEYARKFLNFPENYKLLAILPIGKSEQNLKNHSSNELNWEKIHKEVF